MTTPDHQGLQLNLQMKKPCNTPIIDDELPQSILSTIAHHSTQDRIEVIDDHSLFFA